MAFEIRPEIYSGMQDFNGMPAIYIASLGSVITKQFADIGHFNAACSHSDSFGSKLYHLFKQRILVSPQTRNNIEPEIRPSVNSKPKF